MHFVSPHTRRCVMISRASTVSTFQAVADVTTQKIQFKTYKSTASGARLVPKLYRRAEQSRWRKNTVRSQTASLTYIRIIYCTICHLEPQRKTSILVWGDVHRVMYSWLRELLLVPGRHRPSGAVHSYIICHLSRVLGSPRPSSESPPRGPRFRG